MAQIEIINYFGTDLDTSKCLRVYEELTGLIGSENTDTLMVKVVVNYVLNENYTEKIDILPSIIPSEAYYFIVVIRIGHSGGDYTYHYNLPDSLGSCRVEFIDNLILLEKLKTKVRTPDDALTNVLDAINVFKELCSTNNRGDIDKLFYEYMKLSSFISFDVNSVVRDTGIGSFPAASTTGIVKLIRYSNVKEYSHNSAHSVVMQDYVNTLNDSEYLASGVDIYIVDQINLKLFLKIIPLSTFEIPSSRLRIVFFINENEDLIYIKSFPSQQEDPNPSFRQGGGGGNSLDEVFDVNGIFLKTISRNIDIECERNSIMIQGPNNTIVRIDSILSLFPSIYQTSFYLPKIMEYYWSEEYRSEDLSVYPVFVAKGYSILDTVSYLGRNFYQKIIMPYELGTGRTKTANKYVFLSVIVHEYRHFVREDTEYYKTLSCENRWKSDTSHVLDVYFYQLGRKTNLYGGKYLSDLMCEASVDGSFANCVGYLDRFIRKNDWYFEDNKWHEFDELFVYIQNQFKKQELHKLKGGYRVKSQYSDPRVATNQHDPRWTVIFQSKSRNIISPNFKVGSLNSTFDKCD